MGTDEFFERELDGFDCIRERTGCLGDNRDVRYMTAGKRTPLTNSDVHVLIGTNSVNTNHCVYTNLGMYTFIDDTDCK